MGGTLPYTKIEEVLLESQQSSIDIGKYGVAFGFAKRGKPNVVTKQIKTKDFETVYGTPSLAYNSNFLYTAMEGLGAAPLFCLRIGKDVLSGGLVIMETGAVGTNHSLVAGLADPTAYAFAADELLLFCGSFYGDDDNNIGIRVVNVDDTAKTFVVQVFEKDSNGDYQKVEEHYVSRKREVYDGFGESMYVVDKINANSAYIICVDNTLTAETVSPKEQATTLACAEGDSGTEPTNSEIVTALDYLSDTNALNIFTFPDCGFSHSTVQQKIKDICEAAEYSIALLSIPANSTASEAVTHKTTAAITSEYAAYYYPNTIVTDTIRKRTGINLAASSAMQKQYLNPGYDQFQVPMGKKFLVPGTLERILSATDAQTVLDAEINPILFTNGVGNYSVSENTCYPYEGFAQRLSIRLLLNYIKWWMRINMDEYMFERFTISLMGRAQAKLNTLKDYLLSHEAVLSGTAICDETINNLNSETLNIMFIVSPTSTIKNMYVKVVVSPYGINISEGLV